MDRAAVRACVLVTRPTGALVSTWKVNEPEVRRVLCVNRR